MAAQRQIDDRLAPNLENDALQSLLAVLQLHAPLILATAEGRALQEHADRNRMTRAQEEALRADAAAMAASLAQADDLIDAEAAGVVSDAASAIGQGLHPNRGSTYGIATLQNVLIILMGAALVSTVAGHLPSVAGTVVGMSAWEAVKRAPSFVIAAGSLGQAFDRAIKAMGKAAKEFLARLAPFRTFVRTNEASLRSIAANAPQLRWLHSYIDFLVKPDVADAVRTGGSGLREGPPTAAVDWAHAVGTDRYGRYADLVFHDPKGSAVTQRLRWINRGDFMMGSSPDDSSAHGEEGPRHSVALAEGFWMFDTPCTQALWLAAMHSNPSRFKSPFRPVETVCLEDVKEFLRRVNAQLSGLVLRLPSEAQWEYACRAGSASATYAGPMVIQWGLSPILDAIAWYRGNSDLGDALPHYNDLGKWVEDRSFDATRQSTHAVGLKRPNNFGLYDTLGNVAEWCADHWHDSYVGAPADGSSWVGDDGTANHVARGGSWGSNPREVRASARRPYGPGSLLATLGFRCVGKTG